MWILVALPTLFNICWPAAHPLAYSFLYLRIGGFRYQLFGLAPVSELVMNIGIGAPYRLQRFVT